MKRTGLLFLLVVVLSGAAFAQADITGLGTDLETVIEELGKEMLPNIQQLAAWGQFPGQAHLPEDSRFFFTLSGGAILGLNGILNFVEPTNAAFDTLNVYTLFETILAPPSESGTTEESDAALERVSGLIESINGFFPYPMARSAFGVALPSDFEAMVDFAILPQFLTNAGVNFANRFAPNPLPPVTINALHVGSRVRKTMLEDAPGLPAISIGAGYSYTGFNIGYDFGDIEPVDTAIGFVNFAGELFLKNRVHSVGLDLQVSKNLGWFVPFVGVSPYYQFTSFAGGFGDDFEAYVDNTDDGIDSRDIPYDDDPPFTDFRDDDLTLVVTGGFDLVFGNLALQVHGSYNVGEGYPGVTIGTRWQ